MFTVIIRDLEVYAYHGLSPEERVVGHRYMLNIEVDVEGDADRTDRMEGTVDYAAVAQLAQRMMFSHQCRTVERIAREIGEEVLLRFQIATSVEVEVAKRLPPAPFIADMVGCRLVVERRDLRQSAQAEEKASAGHGEQP